MQGGVRLRYVVIGLIVIAAIVAGGFRLFSEDGGARTVKVPALGISAEIPDGWMEKPPYPEPRLSVYLGEQTISDDCPDGVDTTVWVTVGNSQAGVATVARPEPFDSSTGIKGTDEQFADVECSGMTSQFVQFTGGGKTLAASLLYGKDVSPTHLAEAYGILNSLKVTG